MASRVDFCARRDCLLKKRVVSKLGNVHRRASLLPKNDNEQSRSPVTSPCSGTLGLQPCRPFQRPRSAPVRWLHQGQERIALLQACPAMALALMGLSLASPLLTRIVRPVWADVTHPGDFPIDPRRDGGFDNPCLAPETAKPGECDESPSSNG